MLNVDGDRPKHQKLRRYHIRFFLIDIVEVQTAEGKRYLLLDIDRTAKFAVAQLVATADRKTAWEFLQHMLEAVPYQVHAIPNEKEMQFAEPQRYWHTIYFWLMRFDMSCDENEIEHRLITFGPMVTSSKSTEQSSN